MRRRYGKEKLTEFFSRVSIRSTIYLYFTISALTALILMGFRSGRLVGPDDGGHPGGKPDDAGSGKPFGEIPTPVPLWKLSDSLYYDVIKECGSFHGEYP